MNNEIPSASGIGFPAEPVSFEENTANEQKDAKKPHDADSSDVKLFTHRQYLCLAGITIIFILSLTALILGYILVGVILVAVHSICMVVFMYTDAVQRNIDSSMSSVSDSYTDGTDNTGRTEHADSELLKSLQEKCRTQVAEIQSLKDQLAKGDQEKTDSGRQLEEMKKAMALETLLPESRCVNTFEPVNIISVARQVAETFRKPAERAGVSILVSASADNIMVKADPTRINILFRNIVDNSVKYMQREGSLVITISTIGDDIFIVLKDNGNGLSEDETQRIFELNYQGSNRISGNGLGLAQARAIVNSYGGTIYAKSTEGGGMGIYIQLPTN